MNEQFELIRAITSRRKYAGIFFRELATKIEAVVRAYKIQENEFTRDELGATISSLKCETFETETKLVLCGEFAKITAVVNRPPGSVVISRSSFSSIFGGTETVTQICVVEVGEAYSVADAQIRLSSHDWLRLAGEAPAGVLVYEYAKLIAAAVVARVLEHDLVHELKCKKQSLGIS